MIELAEIEAARDRITGAAVRTPLLRLRVDAPADIYLKLENLQPIGSFKIRGATNAVLLAPPSRLMAASFASGACSGTTIVAGTPSSRAAHATPWAMFPALAVSRPPAVALGGASRTALVAPRILNELIG